MVQICLTLTEESVEDALGVYNEYKDNIDMVELRLDYLKDTELSKLEGFLIEKPAILTFRKEEDGGKFQGSEGFRIKAITRGLETGNFKFVDLEENLVAPDLEDLCRKKYIKIIRSFHDFNGVPSDLTQRILSVKEWEMPKAAIKINSVKELIDFYTQISTLPRDLKRIVLGMGPVGFNTRILAHKLGSYLTFTSKEGVQAAPGHVSPDLLNNVYRVWNVDDKTNIFGIIGNPVMHTKSPIIHNSGYRDLNLACIYVPFEVDNLGDFMVLAKLLNLQGFSVTVPFKEEIIPYLEETHVAVKEIGACNTVVYELGKWVGYNTDYIGFIKPLIKAYGNLRGKKVSLIGSGGAAKAGVYALTQEGAEVLILNRTEEKARALAKEFDCYAEPLNSYSTDMIKHFSDIIVQTTNVGMHPLEHSNPLEFYKLKGTEFLYDIIYSPEKTRFLWEGEKHGCRILNGWEMLLEQGYEQFKYFTGQDYPQNSDV